MQAKRELCFLCFEALVNKVTKAIETKVSSSVIDRSNATRSPLFVTWTKSGEVRGCMGNFRPLPLYSGLQEYALRSGVGDSCISPIVASEFPQLECGVSLLHSFEPAANALDWEIGVHGIVLSIDGCSATFLPETAKEHEWTKEVTLSYLAEKADFWGTYDSAAIARSRVKRYQSSKCKVTWQEYQEYLKK